MGDEENQSNADKLSQTKISLTNSLTDVNEDLINEKNNEIGRVTKWAIGFEKLLEDPLGLQIFTVNFYLKKESIGYLKKKSVFFSKEFFENRIQ